MNTPNKSATSMSCYANASANNSFRLASRRASSVSFAPRRSDVADVYTLDDEIFIVLDSSRNNPTDGRVERDDSSCCFASLYACLRSAIFSLLCLAPRKNDTMKDFYTFSDSTVNEDDDDDYYYYGGDDTCKSDFYDDKKDEREIQAIQHYIKSLLHNRYDVTNAHAIDDGTRAKTGEAADRAKVLHTPLRRRRSSQTDQKRKRSGASLLNVALPAIPLVEPKHGSSSIPVIRVTSDNGPVDGVNFTNCERRISAFSCGGGGCDDCTGDEKGSRFLREACDLVARRSSTSSLSIDGPYRSRSHDTLKRGDHKVYCTKCSVCCTPRNYDDRKNDVSPPTSSDVLTRKIIFCRDKVCEIEIKKCSCGISPTRIKAISVMEPLAKPHAQRRHKSYQVGRAAFNRRDAGMSYNTTCNEISFARPFEEAKYDDTESDIRSSRSLPGSPRVSRAPNAHRKYSLQFCSKDENDDDNNGDEDDVRDDNNDDDDNVVADNAKFWTFVFEQYREKYKSLLARKRRDSSERPAK